MMRQLLSFLLILLSYLPGHRASSSDANQRFRSAHRAEHYIVTANDNDAAGCTAYAIGPHALLTAEHCDMKDVDDEGHRRDDSPIALFVDFPGHPDYASSPRQYQIVGKEFDGSDHMILLVSGPEFKDVLEYKASSPYQGEKILTWGNPQGVRDQYREGYVTGTSDENVPFQTGQQTCWIASITTLPGDSGSAVLDAADGHIVGVVTYGINGGKFMGFFELHFSPEEVSVAQAFGGERIKYSR